jgi:hypothetical protein
MNLPGQDYSVVSDFIEPQLSPCSRGPLADVWLRDNEADDGSVPSAGRVWLSPDVWNRLMPDGNTAHQNPEVGQANYLYVRLRNRSKGERAKITSVDVWLAPASTCLRWPEHFQYVGRISAANLSSKEDRIIGPLRWNPPNSNSSDHFSFYVRAISPHDPITRIETKSVLANTRASNNIAWRNVNVVDIGSKTSATFLARNISQEESIDLLFDVPEAFLRVGNVQISLPLELEFAWLKGRGNGSGYSYVGASELPRGRGTKKLDEREFKRLRNASEPPVAASLKLKESKVELNGLQLIPGQAGALTISFTSNYQERKEFPVDVLQRVDGKIVGGIRYLVRTGYGKVER